MTGEVTLENLMEEEFEEDEDNGITETEEVFVEEDGLESPHSDEILKYDSDDDEYEIETMENVQYGGKKLWKWPSKVDSIYYEKRDIVEEIDEPEAIQGSSGRGAGLYHAHSQFLWFNLQFCVVFIITYFIIIFFSCLLLVLW